jgi:hypothetical protein
MEFKKFPSFYIEHCQDCKNHGWNTRHDEAKYLKFALELKQMIE